MQFEVRSISPSVARQAVSSWHYLGNKPFRCGHAVGLFDGTALVGAAVFHGLSAPETAVGAFGLGRTDQAGLWELGRLVLAPHLNGDNVGTWFLSRALKSLRVSHVVRAVISYADSSLHNGGIYRAASFVSCGLTTTKADYFIDGRIQERGPTKGRGGEWRPRPRKHRFVKVYDHKLTLRWPTVDQLQLQAKSTP